MTNDPSIGYEEVPLLHSERTLARAQRTPFPWFQFLILFALQTAEYLPLNTTHPFIPDLIRSIGIAKGEKEVGRYVGPMISTAYAAEMVTTLYLSQLSDKIGRKPVFLACIICSSVSISGFGLSKTFWTLILCQASIGAFRATCGVTKSMLAGMADPADIARAISYYETSWYVSATIGSKIGGSLSRPVDQFPRLFGSNEFLKRYPYFLPCAICSMLLLTAWLVGTIFLRETVKEPLPLSSLFNKKTQKDVYVTEEGGESIRKPLLFRTVFLPGVIIAAINLASLSLLQKFFSETEALYLSTPIRDGGLGLSLSAIGTCASIRATVIGLSQLFVFPRMHDKWGSRYIFVLGLSASIPQFLFWPLMNWIAGRDDYSGLLWFTFGIQICCSVLTEFAWLAMWVLITQSYGSCATVPGFCQTVASLLRALAPAISNTLFSLSIDKGYLGGYMVYFVFVGSAAMALCASSLLPRGRIALHQKEIGSIEI